MRSVRDGGGGGHDEHGLLASAYRTAFTLAAGAFMRHSLGARDQYRDLRVSDRAGGTDRDRRRDHRARDPGNDTFVRSRSCCSPIRISRYSRGPCDARLTVAWEAWPYSGQRLVRTPEVVRRRSHRRRVDRSCPLRAGLGGRPEFPGADERLRRHLRRLDADPLRARRADLRRGDGARDARPDRRPGEPRRHPVRESACGRGDRAAVQPAGRRSGVAGLVGAPTGC